MSETFFSLNKRLNTVVLAGLLAAAILIGFGAYMMWKPSAPKPPIPAAGAAAGPAMPEQAHALTSDKIDGMTERLRTRLKEQPSDAEGWAMLGRTYAVMGKPADAVPAFEKAAALRPLDAVLLADYADALATTRGRNFEGEPLKLIERALKSAPDNLKALSMAGSAAFNRKDYAQALTRWDKLAQLAPPDSVFVKQVQAEAAKARELAKQGSMPPASK